MRNIKKSFLELGVGTIIYFFISAIVTPIITRIVSPDEYGRWSLFVMYGTLGSNILLLGMDQAFVRYYYVEDDLSFRAQLLQICTKYSFSISMILIGLASLIAFFLRLNYGLVLIYGAYLMSAEISRFGSTILRLEYKTKLFSLMQCADKIMLLIFTIILVFTNDCSNNLIYASSVVGVIVSITYLFLEKNIWFKTNNNAHIIDLKEILVYGVPSAISLLVTSVFQATDKTVISLICGDAEVGIYAGAMSIVNIFAIIQTVFTTIWMPMAIEHYEKDGEKSFYVAANKYISLIMIAFGICLITFKDIIIYFLGAKYRRATLLIPFLAYLPIMYTISETTVIGIVFKKKSVYQIWVGVGSLLINVALDVILVPRMGALGAAIATAASYMVFFIMRTILSQRLYKIEYEYRTVVPLIACLILYSVICVLCTSYAIKAALFIISMGAIFICNKKSIKELMILIRSSR